jgi:hypothetical protein
MRCVWGELQSEWISAAGGATTVKPLLRRRQSFYSVPQPSTRCGGVGCVWINRQIQQSVEQQRSSRCPADGIVNLLRSAIHSSTQPLRMQARYRRAIALLVLLVVWLAPPTSPLGRWSLAKGRTSHGQCQQTCQRNNKSTSHSSRLTCSNFRTSAARFAHRAPFTDAPDHKSNSLPTTTTT